MMKLTRVWAYLAVAAVLASTGGCVMQSTHDAVLTKLSGTEGQLRQSQSENTRLRSGLIMLVGNVDVTATKVETIDTSVQKLRADGDDVAAMLSELRKLVTAQVATIATLGQDMGPLKDEIDALRAKLADLSGRPKPAAPSATTTPDPDLAAR